MSIKRAAKHFFSFKILLKKKNKNCHSLLLLVLNYYFFGLCLALSGYNIILINTCQKSYLFLLHALQCLLISPFLGCGQGLGDVRCPLHLAGRDTHLTTTNSMYHRSIYLTPQNTVHKMSLFIYMMVASITSMLEGNQVRVRVRDSQAIALRYGANQQSGNTFKYK